MNHKSILRGPIQFHGPDKASGGDESHLAPQDHEREEKPVKKSAAQSSADFEQRKAEFFKKHGAGNQAPPEQGGSVNNPPNQAQVEQATNQSKAAEDRRAAEVEAGEKKAAEISASKPKPFIKQQIEAKRTAETERDELQKKAAELEAKLVATQTEKESLEKKLQSGDYSPAKEAEFTKKIAELEAKSRQESDALVNENQKLRDRVSFYDLTESPDFQREYIVPVRNSYQGVMDVIGSDQAKKNAFSQALVANAAALRAGTAEDRAAAELQRDTILAQIVDGLNAFTQSRFTDYARQYIDASARHAQALQNHERTTSEIKTRQQEIAQRARVERMESWGKTYEMSGKPFDDEAKISDDDKKIAKELGIDIDTELAKSNALARSTVMGQSAMEDGINLIHQGRIHIALKAKVAVMEKKLTDRDAIIAKLRGGGPGNAESQSSGGESNHKETREEWQRRRFGASRAAVSK